MFKLVRKSDAAIRKIAENKRANTFITKDISPNVSLSVIEAENYNDTIKITQNFIYYVLEGELTLDFKTEKVTLHPGDSCYIEKNSTYIMQGTFKSIAVSQPAFGHKVLSTKLSDKNKL